ncbi:glutamate--tRNA ligase [Methylocystis sp. MJC1]|jgi:glutamyl-tRNA synthetase|uniref:glutamate--tRNA ligase n=1 Tax=Methylocystis sp. MJC1 TaxID=2654282 RepID=UPI0013EA4F45|nr:glutamate--tRNA ligase [Methylocystis sp. MJC1]KAF2989002.1 Glutamate--tRNA ligase 1 [Methylocystis sp. MJC1]MBU6528286.1 glutamate--tRNA ligase [Methylocystis sp. MJC1]UZX11193.1 glutamate--tRNA ligase [Methylocystis sp. MJC1]
MTSPIVRFAPSPTGRIHIGNARVALFNFLFVTMQHGRFILRFDDTDFARSTEEFARAIEIDLAWLGVVPDAVFRQSERVPLYEAAAAKLRDEGRLYPSYETQEELEKRRKIQQARGLPPIYDRAALRLSDAERAKLETEGRRPHWRFKLAPGVAEWNDLIRGPAHVDCAALSDPVLIREDGSFLYTLPSVADDIDMKITHVIRGEDHVTNTAVQLQLFAALAPEAPPPAFAHHNLLIGASGEGLSKRTGSLSIASLREEGYEAMAVAALATLTGSSDNVQAVRSLAELGQHFDLAHVSRNPARFDPDDLATLTHRTLALFEFEDVRERLAALDVVGHKAEPLWRAARGNLSTFDDVLKWWRVVEGEIEPVREDADFLAQAAALLPQEPWDETTWSAWVGDVKTATGRKGKALFHPLRLALTGEESGPELAALLPLIGRATAFARLAG